MANLFQKAVKLLNPFDEYSTSQVIQQSAQNPGGLLSPERSGPLDPLGVWPNYQPGFGIPAAAEQANVMLAGTSLVPEQMQGTEEITGGGGAGGGSYTPNLVEYPQGSGFYYDINNPTEKQAFFDRRLIDLQQARDQQVAQIDQSIADLMGASRDYVTNYFKQLENFGAVKGAGDLARINAFTQASPNAFQSSETASYDLANKNYLRGIGDAATQANEAVGADYLANPVEGNLGADTLYGRQLAQYNLGRNQVGQQFNDIYAGLQQQNNPATNPFRFDYKAAGLKTPAAVNLSGYNPFVDFKSVPAGATPGAGYVPTTGPSFTQGTPLENFLGTTKIDQQDTDFLRNYLLGQR